jgi:predicted methyltransferase
MIPLTGIKRKTMRIIQASILLVLLSATAQAGDLSVAAAVEQAMWGEHRSAMNTERNRYRHPVGTLDFFGLEKDMTVLEIWPGAGWYTEVLAPVVRDHGKLLVATWDQDVEGQPGYRYELPQQMQEKFEAYPEVYDQVEVVYYSPPDSASLGAADSVDMVLTFRNTHGWVGSGQANAIYGEFARVLKPGGVLGVVQHRAAAGSNPKETGPNGYIPEETVIALAKAAGLVLEARSDVNANPKDSRDHPEGVWTLPPSLRLGDEDREKYTAIGESDRMTLRFRKPVSE